MDHLRFKSSQTAASYVAGDLPDHAREQFELHMMDCTECVDDVEVWRALKAGLAGSAARAAGAPTHRARADRAASGATQLRNWRIAATLLLGVAAGGSGGWWLHSAGSGLDGDNVAFVTLPDVTRGADCSVVRFAAEAEVVAVHVRAATDGREFRATDFEGRELASGSYAAAKQPDQSWVVRFAANDLAGRDVRLMTRAPGDVIEPIACIAGVRQGQ